MSRFMNNVDEISSLGVEIGGSNEMLSIQDVVRDIIADPRWKYAPIENIEVSTLTGGITNTLYLVNNSVIHEKVIVRVFGSSTETFIDRRNENILFAKLSALKLGPIFYGLFQNGRVEGFVNARPLTPSDLCEPTFYRKVAKSVAVLHSQNIIGLTMKDNWLWDKIELFLGLAKDKQSIVAHRQRDCVWLQTYLESLRDEKMSLSDLKSKGMLFGFTLPLAHNDLSASNLLLPSDSDATTVSADIVIIDYEYGSYNYRAFDIAHHFDGCCGYEMNLSKYPSVEHRLDFVRVYLSCLDREHLAAELTALHMDATGLDTEEFADGFQEICHIFTLASHLLWGSWALVQSVHSKVDFDYLAYAERRFNAFDQMKREFNL